MANPLFPPRLWLFFLRLGFNENFGEDSSLSLRLNYYPPCPQPELVLGIHPHSDAGGITLLMQDSDIEGLNIKKEDSWISVKPIPNAFIVNIGDILEVTMIVFYCT
jgi:isopenicillin N synthase-like dioxygenase